HQVLFESAELLQEFTGSLRSDVSYCELALFLASFLAFRVKPATPKSGTPQPLCEISALSGNLPDQLRLKIFDHQNNRPLIQPEDPRRHPSMPVSAFLRIGGIETRV